MQNQVAIRKAVDPQTMKKRQDMADEFEKYVNDSGIKLGFEIIFAEIIEKKVPQDMMFPYAIQ